MFETHCFTKFDHKITPVCNQPYFFRQSITTNIHKLHVITHTMAKIQNINKSNSGLIMTGFCYSCQI